MADDGEAAIAPRPTAVHLRVRAGLRRPHNWLQLVKFTLVGGSGYVVNLAVFALAVEVAGLHHLVGATLAFVVAVLNNFWWNLELLVSVVGVADLPAQAISIVAATPLNFIGNKMWSFAIELGTD